MNRREISKTVRGQHAVDGAGVRLVRVLGNRDVYDFDPFLMLDSFDSTDPSDYTAGFPWHPHRGIETITYLISGRIEHMDSLGNKGEIAAGESQWMTAGSGILHQEMPPTGSRNPPSSAVSGSSVSVPNRSVAQPDGMLFPSLAARTIFPIAAALTAMSTTIGGYFPLGNASEKGLLPTTFSAPPGAGINDSVLLQQIPIIPLSAARIV